MRRQRATSAAPHAASRRAADTFVGPTGLVWRRPPVPSPRCAAPSARFPLGADLVGHVHQRAGKAIVGDRLAGLITIRSRPSGGISRYWKLLARRRRAPLPPRAGPRRDRSGWVRSIHKASLSGVPDRCPGSGDSGRSTNDRRSEAPFPAPDLPIFLREVEIALRTMPLVMSVSRPSSIRPRPRLLDQHAVSPFAAERYCREYSASRNAAASTTCSDSLHNHRVNAGQPELVDGARIALEAEQAVGLVRPPEHAGPCGCTPSCRSCRCSAARTRLRSSRLRSVMSRRGLRHARRARQPSSRLPGLRRGPQDAVAVMERRSRIAPPIHRGHGHGAILGMHELVALAFARSSRPY